MIKINAITIQGFKSFKEEQILSFFDKKGLYLITGENLLEPELEGNGIGKSTIIDAICFCLFGKSANNLIASNISNWECMNPCVVALYIEKDGESSFIERTWNPNSLKLNKDIVTQEQIEDYIGYNFKSFLYSVVIAQFNTQFFDLTSSDKMEVFSEIMGDVINKWENLSDFSKLKLTSIESNLTKKSKDISFFNGKLQSIINKNYDEEINSWDKKHLEHIREEEKEIKEKGKEISELKEKLFLYKKEIINKNSRFDFLEKESVKKEEQIKKIEEKRNNKISSIYGIEKDINKAEKEINEFNSLSKNTYCPTCKEEISKDKIKNYILEIKDKKEEFKKELEAISKEEAIYTKEYLNISSLAKKEYEEYISLKNDIKNSKNNILEIEGRINKLNEEINSGIDYSSSLKKEINPFIDLKNKISKEKNILERKLLYLEKEVEDLKENLEIYKYWIKGFKEIRFMLIEEALKEFEININNNLPKLGLKDWYVELAVDSTTKKGTVKKGFTVKIKSPKNENLVPFEVWSGGESQRLRLAGTLGLIDFISSRRGTNINIEIWDEPTQWLAKKGIDNLLSVLRERAEELDKEVFLIDHRNLNTKGIFSDFIKIIKDKDGSKFI